MRDKTGSYVGSWRTRWAKVPTIVVLCDDIQHSMLRGLGRRDQYCRVLKMREGSLPPTGTLPCSFSDEARRYSFKEWPARHFHLDRVRLGYPTSPESWRFWGDDLRQILTTTGWHEVLRLGHPRGHPFDITQTAFAVRHFSSAALARNCGRASLWRLNLLFGWRRPDGWCDDWGVLSLPQRPKNY